jgi:transcription-repair coupling factor (superfamily II helicase)
VLTLLTVARLKVYGATYGIQTIASKNEDLIITMNPEQNARIDGQKLFALSNRFEHKLRVIPGAQIVIAMQCKKISMEQSLQALESFLQQYGEVLNDSGFREVRVI